MMKWFKERRRKIKKRIWEELVFVSAPMTGVEIAKRLGWGSLRAVWIYSYLHEMEEDGALGVIVTPQASGLQRYQYFVPDGATSPSTTLWEVLVTEGGKKRLSLGVFEGRASQGFLIAKGYSMSKVFSGAGMISFVSDIAVEPSKGPATIPARLVPKNDDAFAAWGKEDLDKVKEVPHDRVAAQEDPPVP